MERKYLEYFDGAFDSTVAEKVKPENKPYVAYSKTEGVVYTVIPKLQPDNEIWYTSINDLPLNLFVANTDNYTWLEGTLINNTYNDGKGVWTLDTPITYITGIETSEAGASIVGGYENEFSPVLKSVSLPNSIKEVRIWSFTNCTNLEYVKLPNCLETIDNLAFLGCSSLKAIEIPNSVNHIGSNAFGGCYFTKENFINNSSLDAEANNYWGATVYDSKKDEMYILDNTLISSDHDISGHVVIPEGITSIGSSAFESRESLTSIEIPNSVTSIKEGAFAWCYGLETITYIGTQEQWEQIDKFIEENEDENKFPWNKAIEDVTIVFAPKIDLSSVPADHIIKFKTNIDLGEDYNVTTAETNANILDTIYDEEYYNIVYDDTVTSINWHGTECMSCASKVTEIVLPDSVQSLEPRCFDGCSSLTSVNIPNSVTSIGWRAFADCDSLVSITIPSSVTSIETDAFVNCCFATDNFVNNSSSDAASNNYWGATVYDYIVDGMYIGNNQVFKVNVQEVPADVIIPEGVTSIGNEAFYDCSSLTSVTIPSSVTSIGDDAFYNCSSLTSITIPDGVTSLGKSAFSSCSSLTSVTIPSSVTSIGRTAFYGCSSLTSVTIPSSVTSIELSVFSDCSSLTSVTIPNSVTSIGINTFAYCKLLDNITFEGTIEQWNLISKSSGWNGLVPTTTVHCIDGDATVEKLGPYYFC